MTIPIDATALMRQATMTAHDNMLHARHDIDEQLGEGYAREHPELIAAYMQTAAIDFATAIIAKEIGEAIEGLSETLGASFESGIAEACTASPARSRTDDGGGAAITPPALSAGVW